jgi:uncharacterized protein YndB with AHSA1/START domain
MTVDVPSVRKSVVVEASVERAFQVFTDGFDTWWPRSHHIGASPMARAVIEGRVGGRCYGHCVDGTDCPWGTVTVWEPPRRFVFAWQITPDWKYQPDLGRASEVEVTFTADGSGTRVDLEHRNFQRHGEGAAAMRSGVDSPNGWGTLLKTFADAASRTS